MIEKDFPQPISSASEKRKFEKKVGKCVECLYGGGEVGESGLAWRLVLVQVCLAA